MLSSAGNDLLYIDRPVQSMSLMADPLRSHITYSQPPLTMPEASTASTLSAMRPGDEASINTKCSL